MQVLSLSPTRDAKGPALHGLGEQEGLEVLPAHHMSHMDIVEGLEVLVEGQQSLKVHHHGQRGQVVEVLEVLEVPSCSTSLEALKVPSPLRWAGCAMELPYELL